MNEKLQKMKFCEENLKMPLEAHVELYEVDTLVHPLVLIYYVFS